MDIQDLVINRISTALSVASVEHRVVADNIAKFGVEGSVRQSVSFERVMNDVSVASGARRLTTDEIAAAATYVPAPSSAGTDDGLEVDMLSLSANTMRYTELSRALSRYFSIADAIASNSKV
jgi:flagellar basal body rod protein FlgB